MYLMPFSAYHTIVRITAVLKVILLYDTVNMVKFLNFLKPTNCTENTLKFKTKMFYHGVIPPNGIKGKQTLKTLIRLLCLPVLLEIFR